jgi:hypothetical protein
MWKKLKLGSGSGDSGSYNTAYAGWVLAKFAFCWNLESDGRFYVGAFDRNMVAVVVKMFSRLI